MPGILDEARDRITDKRNLPVRTPGLWRDDSIQDWTRPKPKKPGKPMKMGKPKQKKITPEKLDEIVKALKAASTTTEGGHTRKLSGEEIYAELQRINKETNGGLEGVVFTESPFDNQLNDQLFKQYNKVDRNREGYLISDYAPATAGWATEDYIDPFHDVHGVRNQDDPALIEGFGSGYNPNEVPVLDEEVDAEIENILAVNAPAPIPTGVELDPIAGTWGPMDYLQPNYNQYTGGYGGYGNPHEDYASDFSGGGYGGYGGNPHGGGFNDGGTVFASNGADLSQHPGEARGTDTVPAWLTEGEFCCRR